MQIVNKIFSQPGSIIRQVENCLFLIVKNHLAKGKENMVIGIGTDLMNTARITPLASDDVFFSKIFTEKEIINSKSSENPYRYLAGRFAAKEAVFKAFGIDGNHVRLNEIETLNDKNGAPFVRLHGELRKLAEARGASGIHISLSSDGDLVLAFAVLCRD